LQNNVKNCNTIIKKFLSNISEQLEDGVKLCLSVPVWFVGGKTYHLALIKQLKSFGFSQELFGNKALLYHRKDQIVGRELLVLTKSASKKSSESDISSNLRTKKPVKKIKKSNKPAPKKPFVDSLIDV